MRGWKYENKEPKIPPEIIPHIDNDYEIPRGGLVEDEWWASCVWLWSSETVIRIRGGDTLLN